MSLVIERKLATETNYTAVTTLQNNNTYGQHNFSYNDDLNGQSQGAIKYRIKMIIAADTTFYLDSMTVNNVDACNSVTENNITIYPNPVPEDLSIKIERVTAAKINIVIQNALGQKIYSDEFQQAAGLQVKTIPMNRMSKGGYFVTVYIDNEKAVTKKILQK